MTPRTATAPGKIVLAGEYAVLGDAPAIAMAVDRRAVASFAAPSPTATPDTRLLESVCREFEIEMPSVALRQDTDAFYCSAGGARAQKLGIGSSAALTVALCKLFAVPAITDAALLQKALAAHRRFQGNAGSGVDVASSLAGGLICYRRTPASWRPLAWPAGLYYKVLWSGVASSTRARLEHLQQQEQRGSAARLASAAELMADCWMSGDALAVLRAHVEYIAALRQFDLDHDLGIFAAGHEALCVAAESMGLAYKPCGAGGGDIGIALATDAAVLANFVAQAKAAGFRPLDLTLDPRGASDA